MNIEHLAYEQGIELFGNDQLVIIEKMKEEVLELEAANKAFIRNTVASSENFVNDELADVLYLINRLAHLKGLTLHDLLRNAYEKIEIRRTFPEYKKSKQQSHSQIQKTVSIN